MQSSSPPSRPSENRRKALAGSITLPRVSNFFPLTRYYEAADTLFASVKATSTDPGALDLCYVYGKRYCMFFLQSIPTHNYYNTPRFQDDRLKHTHQVQIVLDILDTVTARMDVEEVELQKVREQEQQARLDAWTQQQQEQRNAPRLPQQQVAQSALDKLNALNGIVAPPVVETGVPMGRTRYRLEDESEEEEEGMSMAPVKLATAILPPMMALQTPIQPPPPNGAPAPAVDGPPSYHDVVPPPAYETAVKKYHPFSYQEPQKPQPAPPQPNQAPPKTVQQLQVFYKQSHRQLQTTGRIRVQSLNTYQGRNTGSTNGCTVISAMVAATHLNSSSNISNDRIGAIIDRDCCPVLKAIRKKLGLGGHALIIPSDVHDYLVDTKLLHQEKFAGAAGGNILDPNHYGEFLKILTESNTKKASATFFYREHVTSVVKCVEPHNGTVYYDWVDSLPGSEGRATRTRCADAEALRIQLQWYAISKLRPGDNAPWDDSLADLDPRVFQGFAWSD